MQSAFNANAAKPAAAAFTAAKPAAAAFTAAAAKEEKRESNPAAGDQRNKKKLSFSGVAQDKNDEKAASTTQQKGTSGNPQPLFTTSTAADKKDGKEATSSQSDKSDKSAETGASAKGTEGRGRPSELDLIAQVAAKAFDFEASLRRKRGASSTSVAASQGLKVSVCMRASSFLSVCLSVPLRELVCRSMSTRDLVLPSFFPISEVDSFSS